FKQDITISWDGVIEQLEIIEQPFTLVWGPINHLMSVKNSDELRKAYESVLEKVVNCGLELSQSKEIYDALIALQATAGLDAIQQRAIELRVKGMVLSGISLEGDAKKRFNEIEGNLSKLTNNYSNNVLDAIKAFELIVTDKADTAGYPQTLLVLASQSYKTATKTEKSTPETGPWRITLDYPSLGPFLQHSRNQSHRKEVLLASATKASTGDFDNTANLLDLLKLRQEKSELLGFKNFAELSLDVKMAKTVLAVTEMHGELFDASKTAAEAEFVQLQQFANDNGFEGELNHWDVSFWTERQREKLFSYTDSDVRPYFPLPKVVEGLFGICKKLFGVEFVRADGEAPIWHDDVQFYKVYSEEGEHISSFYFDLYTRPAEKSGGAWMNTLWNRGIIAGEKQIPVVYLVCNGAPPAGGKPSLMGFGEVTTLFHEFGHGLQAMMTTVDVASLSGIGGVDWDAVELASQFMENWCFDKPTLLGMTSHVETGETLPEALFDKIYAAKNYMSATQMMRQLSLGMIDMALYSEFDPNGDKLPIEVQQEVQAQCSTGLPPFEASRTINSFTHIFTGGYGAGYYGYKWSEVLSADCFGAFEEAGLENDEAIAKLGRAYRDTVLAMGGSQAPMAVFEQFRGRKPSTEALLRHQGLK
ncbi:MAG: M3 family metallopeptidase, partial [Lentisphaeria bacterium]|nr:M3 family metallopeptidase [Lentisphaeria bacterium]